MQGDGDQTRLRPGRDGKKKLSPKDDARQPVAWTGWRGPHRNGRVPWLPATLPAQPKFLWQRSTTSRGLGGVAATAEFVLYSDRELNDTVDVYYCLKADTGAEVWSLREAAPGQLDYGNSSRATPLIHGDLVYFHNAFGMLHCVELQTGKIVWQMDLRAEFGAEDERKWGMCASPLIVEEKLIVNPGGKEASLVALEPRTGKVLWKSPGAPASYGNFIVGTFGGKKQIVGYDLDSLGGWDLATGRRLWRLVPPRPRDFNVPTPIQVGDQVLVATENNGTRLYRFGQEGQIDPQPVAVNPHFAPDTHSPVIVGQRVFGIWNQLFCLDLANGLQPIWEGEEPIFSAYAAIIASDHRLLIITIEGELLLLDPKAKEFRILSRLPVFTEERGVYSHPALVGSRLYLRGTSKLVCVNLQP